jgi:hypothetical protein
MMIGIKPDQDEFKRHGRKRNEDSISIISSQYFCCGEKTRNETLHTQEIRE